MQQQEKVVMCTHTIWQARKRAAEMFLALRLLTMRALFSCWMWRKGLIRPTKAQKFNLYCRVHVGLISIAHQAIFSVVIIGAEMSQPPDDEEKLCVFSTICVSGRLRKA